MLRAQVLVIFDADMVCEPEFFERMLAELADPSVALARASRHWSHDRALWHCLHARP